MSQSITPDFVIALAKAQGVALAPEGAADAARFAALVLANSAQAFATLAFEDEPSGYAAAQRRNAP